MRKVFEEELNDLHVHFFQMGKAVHESIEKSIEAFIKHDKALAQEVIDNDIHINQLEVALEQDCIELIALQQPVTTDLRKIITVMKATSDLERMADHAVSISKSTIRVKGNKREYDIEKAIYEMSVKVLYIVRKVLDAYVIFDADEARRLAALDKEVDMMGKELYAKCIKFMKNDPEIVLGATDYLRVTTYLERIGDYSTNISEWIVYLETGKVVELNTQNHLKDI
ncbi:phosphate signaling complex protein PhoU [Desemzia incerta]|uniref:phosphate signaling complex protein PhoU n=1 Tax=Desemzia TaxID=82800 RepID=UPI001660761A|nr:MULTISPECIES: phosphate signaling complex protein PhoU [Desemzia]MCI3029061.1 phosphate signaling complex protein PhoU [Desemzia sp. C1]WHZ31066.1 phosphate signaling complex protein PhoU [Desemzia incerta]